MTSTGNRGPARQGLGFLASGLLATATDAAMLMLLTRGGGLDPFSARAIAIAVAMVMAFFAHRRLSFAVATPVTWREFAKFVSVASTAAGVNYAVYSAFLVLRPTTEPVMALIGATAVAMGVTYIGLRFGVFRAPTVADEERDA